MTLAPGHLVNITEDPRSGLWHVISISPPNATLQHLDNTDEFIIIATHEISRAHVTTTILPLRSHVLVGDDPHLYDLLSRDHTSNTAVVAHLQNGIQYTVPLTLLKRTETPAEERTCKRLRSNTPSSS